MKQESINPLILVALAMVLVIGQAAAQTPSSYLSPAALAASPDGHILFVACETAKRVLVVEGATGQVKQAIDVPAAPSSLALSSDGQRLYVTCASPASQVCVVDVTAGRITGTLPAGHTATGAVLAPDGQTLFVCNRFENTVSVLDLATQKERTRIRVQREPIAAAVTPDGKYLLVANHLHQGRADQDYVAAVVSVIDVGAGKVAKELRLPNGSGLLQDIRVSPDGKYACVSHILARFHLPTTQLERGWVNTNAKTIIDLATMDLVNTVLLDNVDRGAANPWGLAWTPDSRTVVVAHAGTHEISVIDFPTLLAKLDKLPVQLEEAATPDYSAASRVKADVPNDLSFLVGVRERLKLAEGDLGPRAILIAAGKVYTANYFSDTLSVVDLEGPTRKAGSLALGPKPTMDMVRKGQFYFHDAGICFQGWQSCASCHPGEARVDGLNWDLLNDGIGNPKNNKSLLLSHRTPPVMSIGVRETAEEAVRAGIRHILFTVQPDEVAESIDAYLKNLQPVPSPLLVGGALSEEATLGRALFERDDVGCAACHPPELFTNMHQYDVGTTHRLDKGQMEFDTPTLVELWRTAPYLHDGSAATVREVLTTSNPKDTHGKTSHLTPEEIDALAAYVLSL